MIWQYNNKYSEPTSSIDIIELEKFLESKELYKMSKDISKSKKELEESIQGKVEPKLVFDRNFYRLSFRLIARDTDERTLIFSLLPKNIGVGNSLISNYPKTYYLDSNTNNIKIKENSIEVILFAISVFNSLIVDYIARFMIQINVNKTYLERLPIPQPSPEEINNNEIYKKLMLNALKLTLHYNYEDFKELTEKFNIKKEDIPKTDKQIDLMKIENDCLVAKLYDISLEELKHICLSFKVLKNKYPQYLEMLLDKYESGLNK